MFLEIVQSLLAMPISLLYSIFFLSHREGLLGDSGECRLFYSKTGARVINLTPQTLHMLVFLNFLIMVASVT